MMSKGCKKQPGENHEPFVIEEVALLSSEVNALANKWDSLTGIRVVNAPATAENQVAV